MNAVRKLTRRKQKLKREFNDTETQQSKSKHTHQFRIRYRLIGIDENVVAFIHVDHRHALDIQTRQPHDKRPCAIGNGETPRLTRFKLICNVAGDLRGSRL